LVDCLFALLCFAFIFYIHHSHFTHSITDIISRKGKEGNILDHSFVIVTTIASSSSSSSSSSITTPNVLQRRSDYASWLWNFWYHNGYSLLTFVHVPNSTNNPFQGYVQRNFANLRPRDAIAPYPKDFDKLQKHRQRQPDKEILDHDRKRAVELKCFELRDKLEEDEYVLCVYILLEHYSPAKSLMMPTYADKYC